MAYFTLTIAGLDRIIDSIEREAAPLAQSKHTREAGDLRAAKDAVKAVRDALLVRDYDAERVESAKRKAGLSR